MTSAGRLPYQYVVLRCVPRPEREEFVNVGVVVFCQRSDFLEARWRVGEERLRTLDPRIDVTRVGEALAYVDLVCRGDAQGGSPAARPIGQRFGFLTAPRSTVLQPGPVHGGLTADPARELERLLSCLVG